MMSSLSIRDCRPADPHAWDRAWQVYPYATYFHSREWAELWSDYTNGRLQPAALELTFSDGIAAVLALSREKGLVRAQHVSSPAGTYGGWVSADELTPEHRAQLARFMVCELGDVVWRVNPFEGGGPPEDFRGKVTCDETQALCLDDSFEAITKRWTTAHRRAVKKARREGVTVSVARTESDWAGFGAIYRDSVRRWGESASSVYGPRLLELIRGRESPHVRLWLAYHAGEAVAGALCLYARRHASYWLGGTLEKAFPLRPVQLLMHEAVEHACDNGYAWFDFNPSGGHQGVVVFKQGFGPSRLSAPTIQRSGPLARATTTARRLLRQ